MSEFLIPDTQLITIRIAGANDFDRIWEIFHRVVKTGNTYAYWLHGHWDFT